MKHRLRIGLISSSSVDGGAERYLRDLYKGLVHRGHRVMLFGELPEWPLAVTTTGVGGKWSRSNMANSLASVCADRHRMLSAVRKANREEPFDLFHLIYKREQILLTRKLSLSAPVLWTEQGRFPSGGGASLLRVAYRFAGRCAAQVVCVSEAVKADVDDLLRSPQKTIVLENAVDVTQHRPNSSSVQSLARRALGIGDSELVMATVSRLHPDKGIALAIEAARELTRPATLVIAGDGPDRSRLERLAGNSDVRFTGHLNDVRTVFAAADVFMFLSTPAAREGSPTALLQASAHGLPTVAVAGCGAEDSVVAAGGVVTVPQAAAVASAIESLDNAGARAAARRWAEAHDIERLVQAHECVMLAVAAGTSTTV